MSHRQRLGHQLRAILITGASAEESAADLALWEGEAAPPEVADLVKEEPMPPTPRLPLGVRTRLRTVLALSWDSAERAAYFKGEGLTPIALPHTTWVDMGRPTTITVTIEPGDRLNG